MIRTMYKHSMLYYNMLKELIGSRVSCQEFDSKYWDQRDDDLDEDNKLGLYEQYSETLAQLRGNYKIFYEQPSTKLYERSWSSNCLDILAEYEEAAIKLDVKGEWFFMGILNFIEEYIREYTPSDAPYFKPEVDVDESTLARILTAAYDVLTRNKDRWLLVKDGGVIEEDNDPSVVYSREFVESLCKE